jgi:hypothetical protein
MVSSYAFFSLGKFIKGKDSAATQSKNEYRTRLFESGPIPE